MHHAAACWKILKSHLVCAADQKRFISEVLFEVDAPGAPAKLLDAPESKKRLMKESASTASADNKSPATSLLRLERVRSLDADPDSDDAGDSKQPLESKGADSKEREIDKERRAKEEREAREESARLVALAREGKLPILEGSARGDGSQFPARIGVVDLVLHGILKHITHPETVSSGLGALCERHAALLTVTSISRLSPRSLSLCYRDRALAIAHPGCLCAGDAFPNEQIIIRKGGVPVVLNAMNRHLENSSIQNNGCLLLWHLSNASARSELWAWLPS